MPFRDRTGPLGLGPRTGRAMGYCAGFGMPGSANPFPGRGGSGFGQDRRVPGGLGRGRGWRCSYRTTGLTGMGKGRIWLSTVQPEFTAKDEINVLQDQADFLKRQLEEIQNRIDTLERGKKQESE